MEVLGPNHGYPGPFRGETSGRAWNDGLRRPAGCRRPAALSEGSARDQRPSRDFTLLPKVQDFEPSQLIDQVIRPLIELTLLYAWETSDGAM